MTSVNIYHYVYRITNVVENKHYYGKRSSKCDPKLDLGVKYFSSSTDKYFIQDQKLNPNHYKYKVIYIFPSAKLAVSREVKLHLKFNVKNHSSFYNKANQTSDGFDSTGPKSHETRMRMSVAAKGKSKSAEHNARNSEANKGKPKSAEWVAKLIEHQTKFLYISPVDGNILDLEPEYIKSAIQSCCKNPDRIISKTSYTQSKFLQKNYGRDIIGKTYRDLGFYRINK